MYNEQVNNQVVHQDSGLSRFFGYIYQNVALGLLLCGAVSFVISSSPALMYAIYRTPLFFLVLFAPLIISFYMGRNINNMTVERAQTFYWIYVSLVGMSISMIFAVYTGSSIAGSFLMASMIFFGAAAYGRATDTDLSKMGNIVGIALVGLIIAMLVNLFLQSSLWTMIISVASVVIFTGLIAFENQALQNLYHSRAAKNDLQKLAILGSLSLFISFINIFLALLNLFGARRD